MKTNADIIGGAPRGEWTTRNVARLEKGLQRYRQEDRNNPEPRLTGRKDSYSEFTLSDTLPERSGLRRDFFPRAGQDGPAAFRAPQR